MSQGNKCLSYDNIDSGFNEPAAEELESSYEPESDADNPSREKHQRKDSPKMSRASIKRSRFRDGETSSSREFRGARPREDFVPQRRDMCRTPESSDISDTDKSRFAIENATSSECVSGVGVLNRSDYMSSRVHSMKASRLVPPALPSTCSETSIDQWEATCCRQNGSDPSVTVPKTVDDGITATTTPKAMIDITEPCLYNADSITATTTPKTVGESTEPCLYNSDSITATTPLNPVVGNTEPSLYNADSIAAATTVGSTELSHWNMDKETLNGCKGDCGMASYSNASPNSQKTIEMTNVPFYKQVSDVAIDGQNISAEWETEQSSNECSNRFHGSSQYWEQNEVHSETSSAFSIQNKSDRLSVTSIESLHIYPHLHVQHPHPQHPHPQLQHQEQLQPQPQPQQPQQQHGATGATGQSHL